MHLILHQLILIKVIIGRATRRLSQLHIPFCLRLFKQLTKLFLSLHYLALRVHLHITDNTGGAKAYIVFLAEELIISLFMLLAVIDCIWCLYKLRLALEIVHII